MADDIKTAENSTTERSSNNAVLTHFRQAQNSSGIGLGPQVDNNTSFDPDFLVEQEKFPVAVSAIENKLAKDKDAYTTDLGYTLDINKKLTLRDLGQHMTERMLKAMSQENINKDFGSIALGSSASYNAMQSDNPVTNIFKDLFNKQGDAKKPEFVGRDEDDLGKLMSSRYGDYTKDITNYRSYVASCKGLAMGEANVINPPFMFNELDDVRSDFRRPFIGRTYSEEIYDYNMPIVYFQPGLVKVSTAGIQFISKQINKKTERYQNFLRGDGNAIKWAASKVGAGANSIMAFGSKTILDKAQWFKWTPTMTKYLHFVNDLLIELATWMGLIGGNYSGADAEKIFNQKFQDEFNAMANIDKNIDNYANENEAFDNNSSNVFGSESLDPASVDESASGAILESKKGYMGGSGNEASALSALRCLPLHTLVKSSEKGSWEDFNDESHFSLSSMVELAIPLAMDKGAQSSESFSNSTQAHPLVEQYNSMYEESNANTMAGAGINGAQDVVKNVNSSDIFGLKGLGQDLLGYGSQKLKDVGNSMLASAGLSSEAGMVAGGMGRFMLPEVWSDSTFDKSYSISMKLRSPYGHRLSIFENEFVPLAFLIALSAPRKIGLQSYTNPFYVKMFAKGLFSVPMGMITSLSITRGEDSNDRTVEGFFRTTSINISVKDVLPTMAVGVGGGEMSIMNASNLGMNNYIFTLCGIDFIERANMLKMFSNKIDKLKNTVMAYDPTGLIGDGATGRSNLLFEVSNSFAGRNISRTLRAVGKSENPYHSTTKHNTFY